MAKARKIRILLTGGGTGGHIYPLTAVGRELGKLVIEKGFNPDSRYFGDAGDFKHHLQNKGIRSVHITASKLRRYPSIQNFFDFFNFFFGLLESLWKIFWFMPHVCFSKGGPGALPVVLAARFYAIPLVIHESDAIPGLTNRLCARKAGIIELAFGGAQKYFGNNKALLRIVGNPIREEILRAEPVLAKQEFELDSNQPVILFIGGSQGAEKINNFVLENIQTLAAKFQIIHQVGSRNFGEYSKDFEFLSKGLPPNLKKRYIFAPYFENNIGKVYQAADLIVGRAGAGLIFETAALGKPAILVPLPTSANNHQIANAYEYEKAGAALVIEEENLLPGVVIGEIEKILKDRSRYQKMSEAARKFYIPNSARMIAEDILKIILT